MGFRTDARTAFASLLAAFAADFNTTAPAKSKIQSTHRARPGSYRPPCLFVGSIREPRIDHTMGLRERNMTIELVLVQGQYDNEETSDRQDVLVDAFHDWLTARPHAISTNTVMNQVSTEDAEIVIATTNGATVRYFATVVSVNADISEARNP